MEMIASSAPATHAMPRLALGPPLYYWPRATMFAFYEAMADTALDIVYLGETVCSRRHELRLADWLAIARSLRNAGKEVVLSTQVLLESGGDVSTMHKVTGNGDFIVEANDMGAVRQLAGHVPFIAGPHLNIFNADTLRLFAQWGATRWVMPLEMNRDDLATLQAERPASLATEVFAFGRLPLAFSARCFTARHLDLPKDDCRFSCLAHPDGLLMKTREGEDFLVLNGIQTQSSRVYNLLADMPDLTRLRVDVLRLSPQSSNMAGIIDLFDVARHEATGAGRALADACALQVAPACNGYWHGRPGLDHVVQTL